MHWSTATLLCLGAISPLVQAGFSVYDPYDEEPIARALGITTGCLAQLNKTVECDAVNAARAANGVRDQYWTEGDINALCTTGCSTALNEWYSSVETSCAEDTIVISEKEIAPKMIPQKYIAGYNAVCLQDSLRNWCILESQKWYQNDIPKPKEGDVLDADDVVSMFSQDQYCSECFFLMWKEKLISPSADEEHVASMDRQFKRIVERCAADSPIIKRRGHVSLEQKQDPLIMARKPNRIEPRDSPGTYLDLPDDIPILQGTSTTACAKYYVIQEGDTCPSINRKLGISMSQLMRLNPGIDKYCTTLWEGYAICVTESTNPPPEPVVKVMATTTDDPTVVEDAAPEKRHESEADEPVIAESTCACVDGEEKTACYERCRPFLMSSALKPRVSLDGRCGKGVTCQGSKFGDCCSHSGWCGSSPAYCGYKKCQSGACDKSLGQISIDGKCGPKFPGNMTCVGSKFGECCSIYGYCGTGPKYCNAGACYSGLCDNLKKGGSDKTQGDDHDGKEKSGDKLPTDSPQEKPKDGTGNQDQDGDNAPQQPPKDGDKDAGKPENAHEEQPKEDKESDGKPEGAPQEPPAEDKKDDGKKGDSTPQEPPAEHKKDDEKKGDNTPQKPPKGDGKDAGKGEGDVRRPSEPDGAADQAPADNEKEKEAKGPENEEARILKRRTEPAEHQRFAPWHSRFVQSLQENRNSNETAIVPDLKPSKNVSMNGRCGNGVVCEGSVFGNCCSKAGYCGTGPAYCGLNNCQSGVCDSSAGQISFDGTCGPKQPGNMTCVGSKFGDCCSIYGYCGKGPQFCALGKCASGACSSGAGNATIEEGTPEKEPEKKGGEPGKDKDEDSEKEAEPSKDKEEEPNKEKDEEPPKTEKGEPEKDKDTEAGKDEEPSSKPPKVVRRFFQY